MATIQVIQAEGLMVIMMDISQVQVPVMKMAMLMEERTDTIREDLMGILRDTMRAMQQDTQMASPKDITKERPMEMQRDISLVQVMVSQLAMNQGIPMVIGKECWMALPQATHRVISQGTQMAIMMAMQQEGQMDIRTAMRKEEQQDTMRAMQQEMEMGISMVMRSVIPMVIR